MTVHADCTRKSRPVWAPSAVLTDLYACPLCVCILEDIWNHILYSHNFWISWSTTYWHLKRISKRSCGTTECIVPAAASLVLSTYSANVKSSSLSFLPVAAGQDHPGSSLCQVQSRGLSNASVASCAGKSLTYIKLKKKLDKKSTVLNSVTPTRLSKARQCNIALLNSKYTAFKVKD